MNLRGAIIAYFEHHGDTGQTIDMIASALDRAPSTVGYHVTQIRRAARESSEGPIHFQKPMREGIKGQVSEWLGDRDPHQFSGQEIALALGYETRADHASVRAALGFFRAQWRRSQVGSAAPPPVGAASAHMAAARARAAARVERMVVAGISPISACQQVGQEMDIRLDPADFQNPDEFGPRPVGESVERVLDQVTRMASINGVKARA